MTLRKLLRDIYLDAAGRYAKPAPGIHILNGHHLSPGQGDPEVFRKLLGALSSKCRLIRIEEAVKRITGGDLPEEPLVAFTFDDGFEEQYTGIAPVLEEFGINAAFFILPGFIDGDEQHRHHLFGTAFTGNSFLYAPKLPMTWEQVKDLHRRGHIIGSHGMNHVRLTAGDPRRLASEISDSRQIISSIINHPAEYFAFPFGGQHDLGNAALNLALKQYCCVFSQSDHKHYFSFNGAVINRRHFEPFWPAAHVRFFLSCTKH